METESRRLHRGSWLFIAAGTIRALIRALILPLVTALVASRGFLLSHLDLFFAVLIVPTLAYAFIRQTVYNYRFTETELVVRDGLLTKNTRHISYERIHNVALVRNPLHRLLGVTTARIETAAGGAPEALLRVLSLEAADELRRYTLGHQRKAATDSAEAIAEDTPLLQVPVRELARLGLISNRGFLVVAAILGGFSQMQWWEQDWFKDQNWPEILERIRSTAPGWLHWLLDGTIMSKVLLGVAVLLLLVVILRLLSIVWYVVRYRGFTLRQKDADIRADYGLWPEVSSVIPAHRIQLVTISASLFARAFGRASIDVETAGAVNSGSGMGGAQSGLASTRQWLAPIIEAERASGLVQRLLPELDIEGIEWKPIEARAVRRIVTRVALFITPISAGLATLFSLTPIPVSGWHALWIPLLALPTTWLFSHQWVRRAGYALTECAIYFRSGWVGRQVSAVRFVNMQTVSMGQSPFDRRRRMASVAVDTAGAGAVGHRIHIPFLDVEVAEGILQRLYDETRTTEFRW